MVYYSAKPIIDYAESIDCPYIGIAGGKGNGKTYSIIDWALRQFLETGRVMRYLRRYAESIRPKSLQSLCKPQRQTLINLTGGEYNDFRYYQNRFWLVRRDETGKIVDKKEDTPFMICNALNSVEAFTGADEGECSCIFYDEFLSREKELTDEFYNLQIFHDNCTRNRTHYFCPCILVGNTVTRSSILAREFGVDLFNMKKGDIQVIKNKQGVPRIVFEYCDTVEVMENAADTYYKRFDDNDKIKMIYNGDWTVGEYPHISEKMRNTGKMVVRFKFITPSKKAIKFEFIIIKNKKPFGYVARYTDDNEEILCTFLNRTLITDYTTLNYLPQHGIFKKFQYLVYTKQVYFDSSETGEMFRDFLRTFKGCENLATVYK